MNNIKLLIVICSLSVGNGAGNGIGTLSTIKQKGE